MLDTPVLFIVFNRADTTRQVFEAIRLAKPKQLFVAADGPRADKEGEKEKCDAVRKIATAVDWDCEVKTLFREKNIGCGRGPAEAITWFFEHVEQGIILEDDCLPDPSFFRFCEELLDKYKDEKNIQLIAGANLLETWANENSSYLFSKKGGIWGWATWRRAWVLYDFYSSTLKSERNIQLFSQSILNPSEREVYLYSLEKVIHNPDLITYWDYQLVVARTFNNQFTIVPKVNMIRNIGFGQDATHTTNSEAQLSKLKLNATIFPLIHPRSIIVDEKYDEIHSLTFYPLKVKKNFFQRIIQKIKS